MKFNCEFSVSDRLLPMQNMRSRQAPAHAQISVGCKPGHGDGPLLMVCTAKNRAGQKYTLKNNVIQIFSRFIQDGKLTIRLKNPEHDLILAKSDPLELKCFLNLVKQAAQGLEIKREDLSTLTPASNKDVTKAQTKLMITSRGDYPLGTGFPKQLSTLIVNSCSLKRFDSRILNLKHLITLDLRENCLREIPLDLSKLSLKSLNLSQNRFERIQDGVFQGNLSKSLQSLDLSDNLLEFLPRTILRLKSLNRLIVSKNKLKFLPQGLVQKLAVLQAASNELKLLPADFTKANLDELDLSGNPLQSEIESAVNRLSFPSLLELSARCVKQYSVRYQEQELPRSLVSYLGQARRCSCGSYCFQSFVRLSLNLDLRQVSRDVVTLQNGGYAARVEGFLCSPECYRRYQKNPLAYWRR